MVLPEIPAFEDFLAGAHVVPEEPASGPRELVQRSPGSVLRPGSEVWLAYPSGALQLNSVLKKVGEGLAAVGAPSSRSIARFWSLSSGRRNDTACRSCEPASSRGPAGGVVVQLRLAHPTA